MLSAVNYKRTFKELNLEKNTWEPNSQITWFGGSWKYHYNQRNAQGARNTGSMATFLSGNPDLQRKSRQIFANK